MRRPCLSALEAFEPDDLDGLALALVLGGDGVERGDRGRVPDVRRRQVDDDAVGVVGILELGVEVVAGGEEELAGDGVDRGDVAVGVLDELAVGLGEVGDPAGEQGHRDENADDDADSQVVGGDHDDDGGDHHGGLRLRHPPQRAGPDAVPVEGADRDHDHHRDQGGHRDERDHIAEADHEDEQEDTGQEGGDASPGTGRLHVDHGLADHGAAPHPAEEPGDYVGGPLAPRLAGLLGVGVGDVVDQLGRQQRLQETNKGHGECVRGDGLQRVEAPRNVRDEQ